MKTFKISIEEDIALGMDAISLVESPAVEVDFLAFSKEQKLELTSMDDDQHIITGVVCLADTPILRYNETLGYHNILFEKEVIKNMMIRYFKNNLSNSVNLEHNDNCFVDGVIMFESYIKDSEKGIVNSAFSSIPDGSWIVSYKVEDEVLWNEIKQNKTFKGFSLQGYFAYGDEVQVEESYDDFLEKQFS